MGLEHGILEWHRHGEGWVARIAIPYDTAPDRIKYRRYGHVGIYDLLDERVAGKILARVTNPNNECYLDSVEAAKLWIEANFALDRN